MTETCHSDVRGIMSMIPHRYPFLLIDRIVEVVAGERAVALKNVTANEQFFQGHFPGRPVMPGVLIVEAMAQTAGVLCHETVGPIADGRFYFFVGIDKARFRKPVVPGDQLRLEVALARRIRSMWRFDGTAFVGDERVASAEIMCGESA